MALSSSVSQPLHNGKSSPARFLNPAQAAEFLGVGMNTMAQWRMKKIGPPYSRLNGFLIRYSVADLDAFANAGRVEHHE